MAFPKKKKTGVPALDKPSPIQKAIEQPQSRIEKRTDNIQKPAGNKSTHFHDDESVTVIDEYGYTRQYKDKASYEEAEKINTKRQYAPNERKALLEKGLAQPTAEESAQIQAKSDAEQLAKTQGIANKIDKGPQNLAPNYDISTGSILSEIGSNTVQKAGTGAAAGALTGSAAAGIGAGPGAGIGAVGGAVVGAVTALPSIKSEYTQATQENYATLTAGQKTLRAIINDANNQITSPDVSMIRFQEELDKIDQAWSNTRALSEKDWLTKAKPELVKFEAFNSGVRQDMTNRLALAIAQPNPANNLNYVEELE